MSLVNIRKIPYQTLSGVKNAVLAPGYCSADKNKGE